VESIEVLEDAIAAYDGTVILVSHDRALLRALTTRIWILHERRMTEFAGGFAEWEEVSTSAPMPRRSAPRGTGAAAGHEHQRVRRLQERSAQGAAPGATGLEQAEARVTELESQVARVVAALEDPALYTRPTASPEPHAGAELETLKKTSMRRSNGGRRLTDSRSAVLVGSPSREWPTMQLAMIGLGRMGGNMVQRLLQGGPS